MQVHKNINFCLNMEHLMIQSGLKDCTYIRFWPTYTSSFNEKVLV